MGDRGSSSTIKDMKKSSFHNPQMKITHHHSFLRLTLWHGIVLKLKNNLRHENLETCALGRKWVKKSSSHNPQMKVHHHHYGEFWLAVKRKRWDDTTMDARGVIQRNHLISFWFYFSFDLKKPEIRDFSLAYLKNCISSKCSISRFFSNFSIL